jgi:hypothetical protein
MRTCTLQIELPAELVERLGPPEMVATRTRTALVLELLQRGELRQPDAARLLDISTEDLWDVMAERRIFDCPEDDDP